MDVTELLQRLKPENTTLVGFVSEPAGRGTLSLLFSCLFTLTLCVWSSVHLNLPKPNEGSLEYTWRYIKWSLLGIVGPELVMWTAWRQFISARSLASKIRGQKDPFSAV